MASSARRLGRLLMVLSIGVAACDRPLLARDGTMVLPQTGGGGASVLTANGVEYHDRGRPPTPVIARDANEPWRAPVGFILPASGRFTQTSRPTVLGTTGLELVLRPSDTRVPSWGGEVLVRIDVLAPAAEGGARDGENVALVLEGAGDDTAALVGAALEQLGARDRVAVVDARGARLAVPPMPASDRSLALAAVEKRLAAAPRGALDLAGALTAAREATRDENAEGKATPRGRRIVVLTAAGSRALADDVKPILESLARDGVVVSAIASHPGVDRGRLEAMVAATGGTASADRALPTRIAWLRSALPVPGVLAFKDVVLGFAGTPAPSHVLEASGGEVRWRLDAGELAMGQVRAGDARTDVVRVTVPAWVPGEAFTFTVTAEVDDVARGERTTLSATVPCIYDDDIQRIAESRHGDVIAYASALATLRRLHAAFVGEGVEQLGGLRHLAGVHATSMALLARDMKDPAIARQADMLKALLAATTDAVD